MSATNVRRRANTTTSLWRRRGAAPLARSDKAMPPDIDCRPVPAFFLKETGPARLCARADRAPAPRIASTFDHPAPALADAAPAPQDSKSKSF
jgi:hypothetical protein